MREKILEALGADIDLSDERLLDILIDAYAAKKQRIVELEVENAVERIALHQDRESIRQERHKMRSDPLYCASGSYFMLCNNRKFRIDIAGRNLSMFERINTYDFVAMSLSQEDWMKAK